MPTARGKFRRNLKNQKKVKKQKSSFQLSLFRIVVWAVVLIGSLFLVQAIFSAWKERVWVPGTRVTVIVVQEDPFIYSFDPQKKKLLSFRIPKNTQVQTSGGYGPWLAGSLWNLGRQEGKDGELLRLSMQKSLGIPIDAWIYNDGASYFGNNPLGWISASWKAIFKGETKTNLTFFDRAALIFNIGGLSVRDRKEIDLEAFGVIVPSKLSDGLKGYVVIPEKAKVSLESLRDDLIFKEEKKITITNTTTRGGLALSTAQIGAVLGARVIGAGTGQEDIQEDCLIRGKKENINSLTAKRLALIFSCETKEASPSGASDLELLIGKGFEKRF